MLLVTSLADAVTTERALANGRVELNPFAQNRQVRIVVKIATPVGIYYAAKRLPRKYRILITVAVSSLWGYAAVHNYRNTRRNHHGR